MANSTDPIEKRMKDAQAEEDFFVNVFNRIHREKKDGLCIKYGLGDNQNSKLTYKIPPLLRSTPDFMIVEGNEFYLLEVKGIKVNLWLKLHDYDCYKMWNSKYRLDLFVVNKYSNFAQIRMNNLIQKIENNNYPIQEFPNDHKQCYVIPFQDLLL